MANPEKVPETFEKGVEAAKAVQYERYERAETATEIAPTESAERREAKARSEALETAISVERGGVEQKRRGADSPKVAAKKILNKKTAEASFKRQMKQVQDELPPVQKAFSKLIHNKAIEKTSEIVGATVARPNAILAGAIVAFIAVLVVYIVAKNLGYPLSGFETIGAFIAGWIIGIVYDYIRIVITGKK